MKALVWHGGSVFKMEAVPEPRAERGRVVVKVEACSVCGSDFRIADLGSRPPAIPGHEIAGTIAEIGENVDGLSLGDRVTLDPVQRCGVCWCCTQGIEHLCENVRHLGLQDHPGGWAEYLAVDATNVHRIPDGVGFSAACLAEPVAVCSESFRRAGLREGDTVLIIGDGPFGFIHAQLARAGGAAKIAVAGHYDNRLRRIAEATSAVVGNTHHQDLSELLRPEIGGPGVDIVIEATGDGASPNLGLKALRPRGTLVLFSFISKNPEPLDLPLIQKRELNVLGSTRSLRAYGPCLELMATGKVRADFLVDLEVPLEDSPMAFDLIGNRKADVFKVVFRPHGRQH